MDEQSTSEQSMSGVLYIVAAARPWSREFPG